MKSAAIIAIVATALLAVSTKATPLVWSNCATSSTLVPDASFKMDGEWSCLGEKVCRNLTGNLQSPIVQGAKLNFAVKYLGRVTGNFNGDLWAILAESGYNCPIPPAPKTFHACINWNGVFPNIGNKVTMNAVNGDGSTVFCQFSK
ncbi:hypothetical protein BGZ96_007440 [Linnemannia gamsii]|uniref:MD-2-related lipid-recognition domain-containing protein n=1 Tax=Linnemannia gamsii TaxID=64522 RepID=A0ABQ7K1D1_9FUNG|nr:hypothetical protein BGZ96_007440 [Linnemannia gamsii]